jgi:signal transduction histidine kinase
MMNDFPDEITPDQTRVIMDETTRLTTLVNDVLDISKLESDMERLNISHFSVTQIIEETIARMGELLKNDGFEFDFSYDKNIYVNADKTKIGRVFYNLLINAVNYSGGSRAISVSQTVSGGFIRISVIDSGEGITEDELPFIWDRYYKSGKKHKRAVTGTGLGLSIVKKIMELHGGGYGVISELGKGSTFWFEIRL